MKRTLFFILSLAALALIVTFCNQVSDKNNGHQVSNAVAGSSPVIPESFSIDSILKDYLALKNALVADDDEAAATAGRQLLSTLNKVDVKVIPVNKHKDYMDMTDNAKENAEHIAANEGNIDHQREHLASLSKDIADLIELFGTTQKLYQDHCPIYNDHKGAIWISETKGIKNPYYGSRMMHCGSVEKEF